MSSIIVTGANGFIGRVLCQLLIEAGHTVTGLVRRAGSCIPGVAEWVHMAENFAGLANTWPRGLTADYVVHLAGRAHMMRDAAADSAAFEATNVAGALRVAQAAYQHGVRRFVFVSSIKAIAEATGIPVDEDHPPHPQDAYGRSKLRAEQRLSRFSRETGLDLTIVRLPLVYGPEVRANFLRLLDAVWNGLPLPLSAVAAPRSFIYVANLADALMRCTFDPRAANACFHVADTEAPSVAELLTRIGEHLQRPARLFPVPGGALRAVAWIIGRSAQADRVTKSLVLDTARIRGTLDWHPPYSLEQGLAETTQWYRAMRAKNERSLGR